MKDKDFDRLMYKDSKFKNRFKTVVYSRIILVFFLILVQLIIFFLFCLSLNKYIEVYLWISISLSFLFMIYLVNSKGKNEFKLTWVLLLVLFPLLGISAYILYHINVGGLRLRRKIKAVKEITRNIHPDDKKTDRLLNNFEEYKNICDYLRTQGNFYPSDKNNLKYYSCGEKFYPELLEELQKAKSFIFIEFFIIGLDETWGNILKILEKKAREGVEIRVLYDSIGSVELATSAYKRYLNNKGIKTHIFIKMIPFFSTKLNNRNHRKIVVIDGKTAFTGGLNLSNEYMNYGKNRFNYWKDNAIKIQGAAIQNLTRMFLEDWNLESAEEEDYLKYINIPYKSFPDEKGLLIPYGDDAYNNEDIAEDVYAYLLNTAKKYVYMTSPYVVIDNHMIETIVFAVKRGVDVRLIVPSVPDHYITFCIGKIYLKNLIDAGVKVYLYQKGFIHEKTFISDDTLATVGSVNLDYRSFYHHFECGALVCSSPVIMDIKKDIDEILKDSVLLTQEEYKKIPLIQKIVGYLLRIISPLV